MSSFFQSLSSEKGRLGIAVNPEEWMDSALDMPKLRVVPLILRVACCATMLPQPFHDDPADQIILTTAHEEQAVILTRDQRILNYRYVQSLW
jgi:PIN domain nuclease of toxin-antitoxin system